MSFDLDLSDPEADGMQEAESRQLETFSCGHKVVGPRLAGADQEALTVERRTSEEATTPVDGDSEEPPHSSSGDVVPPPADEQADLVDEAIDESFPASDPPSYWAREAPEPQ